MMPDEPTQDTDEQARLRRAKWLFALFLCPVCGLAFLWSLAAILGTSLLALLLTVKGAVVAGVLLAVTAIVASVWIVRARK